jgi:hypothetical protein
MGSTLLGWSDQYACSVNHWRCSLSVRIGTSCRDVGGARQELCDAARRTGRVIGGSGQGEVSKLAEDGNMDRFSDADNELSCSILVELNWRCRLSSCSM